MPDLNDQQLLRYGRQLVLPEIGMEGQEKLLSAKVLLIGLGGLGSPAAMYLAGSGVGTLLIADGDMVELSNLQRQIIHTSNDIGRCKTDSARDTLIALNPEVAVESLGCLEGEQLETFVAKADIVLDATDNFDTRYAVNKACLHAAKPLVSAAAIRFEGQIAAFISDGDAPCYECLYPRGTEVDESCVQSGIFAPLVGMVGCIQAIEAIKLLVGIGSSLEGKMFLLDALRMEWKMIRLVKRPDCPACDGKQEARLE